MGLYFWKHANVNIGRGGSDILLCKGKVFVIKLPKSAPCPNLPFVNSPNKIWVGVARMICTLTKNRITDHAVFNLDQDMFLPGRWNIRPTSYDLDPVINSVNWCT